jgi:hypothetical protein
MTSSASFSGKGQVLSTPPKTQTGPHAYTPVNLTHSQVGTVQKNRGLYIGLGAFGFVLVVGLVGYQLGRRPPAVSPVVAAASASSESLPKEPVQTAAIPAVIAPPVVSIEHLPVAPSTGVPELGDSKKPPAATGANRNHPGVAAKGTPAAPATTTPTAAPAVANCAQPFFVDENGIKRIKPECR